MSEAAPGFLDPVTYVSPARARLAEVTRDLIDAVMTSADVADSDLEAVADRVEAATAALVGTRASRTDGLGFAARSHGDYLPRSPVVGAASPLAPGTIEWEVVDDVEHPGRFRCIARGIMTAAYEGPPTYVHGGMLALAFDEVLGIANIANGNPGMTGSLNIRYRRPTPLFKPLRWEAWIERVEGRRVHSKAQVWHEDTLCCEAEGLFIQPSEELRQQYFAAVMEARGDGEAPSA